MVQAMSYILSGLNVAPVFDITAWNPDTSVITPALLHFLWCRDPVTQFLVDTLIEEAFRYGPVLPSKEYELPPWVMPRIVHGAKYAWHYGSGAWFLDTGTDWDDLKNPCDLSKEVVDIRPMPLEITGKGGINRYTMNDLGEVTTLYWKVAGSSRVVEIDASHFIFLNGIIKDQDPRGHPAIEPLINTIMSLKLWERTSGTRAKQAIGASHAVVAKEWSATNKTEIKKSLGDTKVLFLNSNDEVQFNEIGRATTDSEIATFQDQSWKNLSAGTGAAQSDMTGAAAGAKLSTDANSSIRVMKLEGIQRHFYEMAEKLFDRLALPGFAFKGWVDPREITEDQRFVELMNMMTAYNNAVAGGDEEMITYVRNVVLEKLVNVI